MLGPSLAKPSVSLDPDNADCKRLGRAAQSCSGLEEIMMKGSPDILADAIKEILCVRKPLLTKFSMYSVGEENSIAALQALSDKAETLRCFSYWGLLPEKGVFEPIVRTNTARLLKKVQINLMHVNQKEQDFDERIQDIVQTFSTCSNLQRLDISGLLFKLLRKLDTLADICCRMRLLKGKGKYDIS